MTRSCFLLAVAPLMIALIGVIPASSISAAQPLSAPEAGAIAKDAYVYGFPLVDSYRILYAYFVDKSSPDYKAPWNQIYNNARVFTANDKAMQTPNSDTPYSQLGLDLRSEPIVLSVPAVEDSRYYTVEINDLYTYITDYVGSRTTGNDAGNFLIAGPHWQGETPPGIKKTIRSETELSFLFFRTQLFEPRDIENVKKIQAGYKIQPLSAFLGKPPPAPAPPINFLKPLSSQEERRSLDFFKELNFVLQFGPIHPSERELMARFAKLDIGPGKTFDARSLSLEIRKAIEDGRADAWRALDVLGERITRGEVTSGDVLGSRAYLKDNYLYRMRGTVAGIWGNAKEEAIYPAYYIDSTGQPLDGRGNRYELHFAADKFPPVTAFWSLTMYDLPARLLVANPLDRYLINSPMLPDLRRDADGGITLRIQHDSPGKELEANWLPAPAGPFMLALRLYWPKSEALDGRWRQPTLERVSSTEAKTQPADSVPVTADNFTRAETDTYFANIVKSAGGIGKFFHRREIEPISNQIVIRGNRDTIYSAAVFDLDAGPVTVTLPDAGKRFMSMIVIDEDQYTPAVYYSAGSHTFTRQQIGTRYLMLALRTFVDPNDDADVEKVHALQDAVKVEQPGGPGKFEVPKWDPASHKRVRDALLVLYATVPDQNRMFGTKEQIDPVRRLIGSAGGWGGNPDSEAKYLNVNPSRNDGKTVYKLTVASDVPVDGFWSITVYDAQGRFEKNAYDAYSVNNLTARKSADRSVDVQFGGCDGKIPNCLPIIAGWNYMVRLYRPRAEILNGSWKFPEAQPAD